MPLQGAELEQYLAAERAAKEKEAAEEAARARTQVMLEADEGDSDSDESDDEEAVEATLGGDMMALDGDGQAVTFEPGAGQGRKRSRRETDLGDWGLETEDGNTKQMISYDIYLKRNVSKQTSFFKSDGGQQQRFRMFPYIERKRRFDSYGELLDVGMWLRKGRVFDEEAAIAGNEDPKREEEEKIEEVCGSDYLSKRP